MRTSTRAGFIRLAALTALSLFVTQPTEAQDAQRGRLEGTVMDSVHARPLVGVRVLALEANAQPIGGSASTDSVGRYHIDSLPPGRYLVGFESPLLDSLEITLTPRAVAIAEGQTARIDMALPPAAKLRGALCRGDSLPPQTGVIYGRVVDPENENPLPEVVLAFSWRELVVDRTTLRSDNRERTASATTDAKGWYRLCGVPTDTWLSLQLQHLGRIGPVFRALVRDSLGIALRHLSFAASTSQPMADSAAAGTDSVAAVPLSGTALLSGIIRGPGDAPVVSAQVGVHGTSAVDRTDASGRYSLGGLPAGTQVLEVRRFGYAPAETSVELRSGTMVTSDVRLQRVVNLDSIRVVAIRVRYKEFNEHRQHSMFGIFLGPEEMQRQRASFMSDVIGNVPGMRVIGQGIMTQVVSSRGVSAFTGDGCKVNIIIDGMENQSINDVSPINVGAMEVYREGPFAPPEYKSPCGAIVIWTKR